MDDFELLQSYVKKGSEDAFAELVNRHINLVYSVALRQMREPEAAAEVTQTVFIILARKAGQIRQGTVIPGWLLRTACYAASNAQRQEHRREQLEQRAMDSLYSNETEAAWKGIMPFVDDALLRLDEKDRDAVVLRFFENKTYKEIAEVLRLTEESARKRVTRAMERLRSVLGRNGKLLPPALLAGAISTRAVQSAPAELAPATVARAMSTARVPAAVLPALVVLTLQAMRLTRLGRFVIQGIAAVMMIGAAVLVLNRFSSPNPTTPPKTATVAADQTARPSAIPGSVPFTTNALKQVSDRLLRFRVTDEATGKAITNAKLYVTCVTNSLDRLVTEWVTDSHGEALFSPPSSVGKGWDFRIESVANGYVPKYVSWSERQNDRIEEMPREYSLRLAHGATIGGVVVDGQSQPVQGARVVLSVTGTAPGASGDRERLTLMGSYHSEYTDGQGRWRCSHVPSSFGKIFYTVRHRDYLEATFVSNSPDAPQPERLPSYKNVARVNEEDLLAGNASMVLKPGIVVAGTVFDEGGFAVAGAKITQNRCWGIPEYNILSGPDGGFRLGNVFGEKLILTFQVDNYAPQDMTIDPRRSTDQMRVVLGKGAGLMGRVTDESGQSISGASVSVAREPPNNLPRFLWRAETDKEGRFEWPTAPTAETTYQVRANGYQSLDRVVLQADGTERVVSLQKNSQGSSVRVSGKVLDSRTQQPIAAFRVLLKTLQKYRTPSGVETIGGPEPKVVANGSKGEFKFVLDYFEVNAPILSSVMEIQADGYWPLRITNTHPATADQALKLELQPGAPISGEVHTPDGQPAKDATVVLCIDRLIFMDSPRTFNLRNYPGAKVASTDNAGRFSTQPCLDVRKIAIAHRSGFAEITPDELEKAKTIRLQAWGSAEGILQVWGEPVAGETIFLGGRTRYYPITSNEPAFMPGFETKTDAQGHFLLEGVPAGEFLVGHKLKFAPRVGGSLPLSHSKVIQVRSGETTHTIIGGSGRVVFGRAVANDAEKIDWRREAHRLYLKLPEPSLPPQPLRPDFVSNDEFSASFRTWQARAQEYWNSPDGLAAQRLQRQYVLVFDQDGRFHVNDVLPGTYELKIEVIDPTEKDPYRIQKFLARLQTIVVVPEAPANDSGEPVDLGTLLLK